jgi:thiol-disulfide isomerase/thioredoxin
MRRTAHGRRRFAAGVLLWASGVAPLAMAGSALAARLEVWPKDRATPPLSLPRLDGSTWELASARGKVVVVNFWASWCEPCRDEMPSLELMAARYEGDGLVAVAVNFKEGAGTIRRFTETTLVTMPILRDAEGTAARAWGARFFPTTVLVGRDGKAASFVRGEVDWMAEPARRWVADLL